MIMFDHFDLPHGDLISTSVQCKGLECAIEHELILFEEKTQAFLAILCTAKSFSYFPESSHSGILQIDSNISHTWLSKLLIVCTFHMTDNYKYYRIKGSAELKITKCIGKIQDQSKYTFAHSVFGLALLATTMMVGTSQYYQGVKKGIIIYVQASE